MLCGSIRQKEVEMNESKQQRIRVCLKAYDHKLIDLSASKIVEVVKRTDARVAGPVPLPTKRRLYCVLRSHRLTGGNNYSVYKGQIINTTYGGNNVFFADCTYLVNNQDVSYLSERGNYSTDEAYTEYIKTQTGFSGTFDSSRGNIVTRYTFDEILVSGDIGIHKPDKEVFEYLANKLDVKCEQCLMVGDVFSTDILGAIKANMIPVWIIQDEERPSYYYKGYRIRHLDELFEILDELNKE